MSETGEYEVRRRTLSGRELERVVVLGEEGAENAARSMMERSGRAWRRRMWAPGPAWSALRTSKPAASDAEEQVIEAREISPED